MIYEVQSSNGDFVLCSDFYISINNLFLFEPRPSKTGRGEGGLLCLDD